MKRRKSGEITVFLSLTLTCICALLCGLLESVRVAGSGWYLQMALNSSLDSLMSKYHREVWENYHLLLLEYETEDGLEREVEAYLSSYMKTDPTYRLSTERLEVLPPTPITSENGRYLEKEILDYMKLGIWNMEQDEETLKSQVEGLREAGSIGTITKRYQEDSRKMLKLEQAIDDIGDCLKRQEQYLKQGKSALERSNGNKFITEAEKLQKELLKIPALVEAYNKKADDLSRKIQDTRQISEAEKANFKTDTWNMVSSELNSSHTYTEQEGERRKAVEQTEERAAENLLMIEGAIEEAFEVQEYIDEWEPDDEDDELDEEALWEEVLQRVNRFKTDQSFAKSGVQDKKAMGKLESLSHLAQGDMLPLVVPENREVSAGLIDLSSYPSNEAGTGSTETLSVSAEVVGGLANLPETALINEYVVYHFPNFIKEEETGFSYEQEYILNGKPSDRENLREMVNDLIKIRSAMNLISLLSDGEKKSEARALAMTITGAAGIAPICGIVTFFILTVWAFAEAAGDVKLLLQGGKIPFLKAGKEFRLSANQILEWGDAGTGVSGAEDKEEGRGLDYQGYIRLFLLLQSRVEKNYRIMDMIQKNIREKQMQFLMKQCAYRVDLECSAKGRYAVLERTSSKAY